MALAPGADFISLKDEYRNMADDKLPLTNDPLPNIQTNKAGFGTDLTVGDKYENLINIKGAKFLDLYRGSIKIDDADDLKEALKSYDVEMSIAFNDNPDNDEFRKAYIVVITNLKDKDTTTPEQPSTGAVQFAKDLTSKDGSIKKGSKVEVLASGKTTATFTLVKPDWAYSDPTDTAGSVFELTYDILVDGEVYAHGASALQSAKSSEWGSKKNNVLTGDKKGASADQSTEFTITDFDVNTAGLKAADAVGKTVTLVVTDIEWKNAVVQYKDDKGNDLPVLSTATKGLPVMDGTGATITIATSFASGTEGTYTITGISDEADGSDVDLYTNVAASDLSNETTGTFSAKGGEPVVVTVTPEEDAVTEYQVSVDDTTGKDLKTAGVAIKLFDGMKKPIDGTNAETAVIKVSTDKTSYEAGQNVEVTIANIAAFADTGVYQYFATVTLPGHEGVRKEIAAGTATKFVVTDIRADVKITMDMIKIERVAKLAVESAELNAAGTQLVITFNHEIDPDPAKSTLASTDITATLNSATLGDFELKGNTLVINFIGASVEAGDEIAVVASKIVTAADDNNENMAFSIEITAKGCDVTNTWA